MAATFMATLYRIKLERDQVKTIKRSANAMLRLEAIKDAIEREKDMIVEMRDGKEFYDMLKCLFEET